MVCLFAVVFLLLLRNIAVFSLNVTVCSDGNSIFHVINGTCTSVVASAVFSNQINKTGWAYLEVHTQADHSDELQAYGAGFAEGASTADLIYLHWLNTVHGYCNGVESYCTRLINFLDKNLMWMQTEIRKNPNDPYWHQVKLMLYQLAGISDGYYGIDAQPHMELDPTGFMMFQLAGDLGALEQVLEKPSCALRKVVGSGSCSAFIKPLAGNKDLLFAHDTWSTYQSMLRIAKLYKLNYHLTENSDFIIPGRTMTFSGYPGSLLSVDDFYLISSGLAVTETTIGNSNSTLYKFVRPTSGVFTWIRAQVTNRLSTSAEGWAQMFQKRNSGTYNNQWMVVDYNRFKPGRSLPIKGLFYILEQIPGHVRYQDMSSVLRSQGYWPSYNIPYFPSIFNLSGSWLNVERYGDWFTYNLSPRALIFQREWRHVTDMKSLQNLMRYNDYKNDPLSRCNCTPPYSAENAIAARCDLNPKNGTYPFSSLGHRSHGATDMKATNCQLFQKLQFLAISGPTDDDLASFVWSESDYANSTPHYGHPNVWNFKAEIHEWKTIME